MDKKIEGFNQEHYDTLKSCMISYEEFDSEKWNSFVAKLRNEGKSVELKGANLFNEYLSGANFSGANLSGAILFWVNFERANLKGADLSYADLSLTKFSGATLLGVNLERAKLIGATLIGVNISRAYLSGADLTRANLEGASLSKIALKENLFFDNCKINKKTDFRNVNLNKIDFSDGAKQTVEYNNRRLNWIDWYKEHKFLRWIFKLFWESSNYGRSITRVIKIFLALSLLFSLIYFFFPTTLEGLIPYDRFGKEIVLSGGMTYLRSLYFSIVTMTTLGFGDIHAAPNSIWGYILLMTQVGIGYGLLGALVTCLSVMFTSDGPAQQLEEEKNSWDKRLFKNTKEVLVKIYGKTPLIVKWGVSIILFILYMVSVIVIFS
jgi:hypothetical protein